jgi:glycolate oxidase iron-sulfur subunit
LNHADATGADILETANPGSQLHLESGLRRRGSKMQVRHVVEVLAEAYDQGRG